MAFRGAFQPGVSTVGSAGARDGPFAGAASAVVARSRVPNARDMTMRM
jgi:hypothetical protein